MATLNSVDNIAAMLAISSPSPNDTVEVLGFYTPNDGGGGTFYWDMTSGTDNGGTILVPGGGTGACWRRVHDSFLHVKWFGAKGDWNGTTGTNDTAAIQAAINVAETTHAKDIYFGTGNYRIDDTLQIDCTATSSGATIALIGSESRAGFSLNSAFIIAGANMPSMIEVSNCGGSNYSSRLIFKNLTLEGYSSSGTANYGIYAPRIAISSFENIIVVGCAKAGYAIGYGWTNSFINCEAHSCGNGFRSLDTDLNNVNFLNCKFLNNDIGVNLLHSARQIGFEGCAFENNETLALYMAGTATAGINNCYFEANGYSRPYCFRTPNRDVYAQIIVNGSLNKKDIGSSFPCTVSITNSYCSFWDSNDYFVAAYGCNRLEVSGCTFEYPSGGSPSTTTTTIVGTGTNRTTNTGGAALNELILNNVNNTPSRLTLHEIEVSDLLSSSTQMDKYEFMFQRQMNFAPNLSKFVKLNSSYAGTLQKTPLSTRYMDYDLWEIDTVHSGALVSDPYGFTIDVSDYPELAGKFVVFSIDVKNNANGMNGNVGSFDNVNPGSSWAEDYYLNDQGWRRCVQTTLMPTSGTMSFAIRIIADASSKSANFANPRLTLIGVPHSCFDKVTPTHSELIPGSGTWKTGDIVYNATPTAGGVIGWVCVTAGSPGTWKGFGEIDL